MGDKIICPIMNEQQSDLFEDGCIEKYCGLWDDIGECCSIKSIAINLRMILKAVHRIAKSDEK